MLRTFGVITAGAGAAVTLTFLSTAITETPRHQLIATSAPPTPPVLLAPNEHGYVRVTTATQAIGCSVIAELVACETSSDSWPSHDDGRHFRTVSVSAQGELHFVDADLGALEGKVALSPGSYRAQGWNIAATTDAITFTNDGTGHGMRVSEQGVQSL